MAFIRNLSRNHLEGPLPAEFGNLRSIQITSVLFQWFSLSLEIFSLRFPAYTYCYGSLAVICHSTISPAPFLQNWASCRTLYLCKCLANFFTSGSYNIFIACIFGWVFKYIWTLQNWKVILDLPCYCLTEYWITITCMEKSLINLASVLVSPYCEFSYQISITFPHCSIQCFAEHDACISEMYPTTTYQELYRLFETFHDFLPIGKRIERIFPCKFV